jgi:putative transposase
VFSTNTHSKFLLEYHLILTVKYRRKLLGTFGPVVKRAVKRINDKRFRILEMEDDLDHMHFLIAATPNIAPSDISRRIKGASTCLLYKLYPDVLKSNFYNKAQKHVFWSPSYFIASVGHTNEEQVRRYIKNQGQFIR